MKFKLKNPISYMLLFLLLGVIYFIIFTANTIRRNDQTAFLVSHTYQVIEKINDINKLVFDFESQVRGYVISNNDQFLSRMHATEALLEKSVREVEGLTKDNVVQQEHLRVAVPLIHKKVEFQNKIIDTNKRSNPRAFELVASLQGKALADSLVQLLTLMQDEEKRLLNIRIEENKTISKQRFHASLGVTIVAFLFLTIAVLRIEREQILRKRTEKNYKNLIENSSLILFTTDLTGNFNYLSGKYKELTGYKHSELIHKSYFMLICEEWREKVQAFYVQQLKKGESESILEFPIRTKSGDIKWVEQNVILSRKKGNVTGFQSFVKDVTEKKLVDEALKRKETEIRVKQEESQKLLQSILDHMPMVVYMKDMEGKLVMANKPFYTTFNDQDKSNFNETTLLQDPNRETINKFLALEDQVKYSLQAIETEMICNTTSGQRDMSLVKFPLLDNENQMFAICTVGKDITEVVRFQRQLITAKIRAEKAEMLQEEFLANMSHEIRTPMNGIIGMTNLMETTELNEEQKEYLDLIKQSSNILLNLINDILDLSKIKAGKMTVDHAHFNLAETMNKVVAPLEYKAKEKGVQINRQIDNVPIYVEGDQQKLVQVLNNLVGNAVKFTNKGEINIQVTTIEQTNELHKIQFIISDTGIGIAKDNLEYIFESFTQASDNLVKKAGGTGLGLAITKKMIEIQGGTIQVASTLGVGSTFSIVIPFRASSNHMQPKIYLQDQLSRKEREFVKGKRILLVEDNLVNQKVSGKLLTKAGLEVDLANDGKHAVDILMNGNVYDLIIMDLRMPLMDGYQTTIYIRNKLQIQVPIIAMTASVLRNEKDKCLEVGMNDYITKPFSPDTLFNKMYSLLNVSEKANVEEYDDQIPSSNEFYNLSYIEEIEDDEYTQEILETFMETTPVALDEIRAAILHGDYQEIQSKAHKLKSSLGVLQVNGIFQLMNEIEALAKKTGELTEMELRFNKAVQQYILLQPMLEADLLEVKNRTN